MPNLEAAKKHRDHPHQADPGRLRNWANSKSEITADIAGNEIAFIEGALACIYLMHGPASVKIFETRGDMLFENVPNESARLDRLMNHMRGQD